MGKFSNTWSLMGSCWQILKKDKELLVLPLISGICCLVVFASFAIPLLVSGSGHHTTQSASGGIVYYLTLFIFYFCNYFVIVFFSSAVVACATIRMKGGDPTVTDGLRTAAALFPQIAGWALISATVGLVLRVIEDRSERLGQFAAGLLGMAWTVSSFMVIPILIVEKKDPVTALKDSAALLRKTWGEQLIGNFSFGLVFVLLSILSIIPVVLGFLSGSGAGVIIGIGLAVLYIIGLALIQSTLQAIFQAALYLYARNAQAPEGFEAGLLMNAIARK